MPLAGLKRRGIAVQAPCRSASRPTSATISGESPGSALLAARCDRVFSNVRGQTWKPSGAACLRKGDEFQATMGAGKR
jgi:hypothetical protein